VRKGELMKTIEFLLDELKRAKDSRDWEKCVSIGIPLTQFDDFDAWYGLRVNIAYCLTKIGKNRNLNLEESIKICKEILSKIQKKTNGSEWGSTQGNLGFLYHERRLGDKAENLGNAIKHYEESLKIITKIKDPEFWATTKASIGHAFAELRTISNGTNNTRNAISNFEKALEIFTEKKYPDEFSEITLSLECLKADA
jgi:tetratricopeptide (TPR) repeat protein